MQGYHSAAKSTQCGFRRTISAVLVHVVVRLPIKQSYDVALVREPFVVMELVLEDSLVQIATKANIEHARDAAQNVDTVIATVARHAAMLNGFALKRSVSGHTEQIDSRRGNRKEDRDASTPHEVRFRFPRAPLSMTFSA